MPLVGTYSNARDLFCFFEIRKSDVQNSNVARNLRRGVPQENKREAYVFLLD